MKKILEKFKHVVKNYQKLFYEFNHGHPLLVSEEAEIIIQTRLNDKVSQWMNDSQIKELVKIRVKQMYKKKFPNAKRWSLPIFN